MELDAPADTREAMGRAIDADFTHLVLGLADPYPAGVAQWVADELIRPMAGTSSWSR